VHQNHEQASPLLSKYLIEKINDELSLKLNVSQMHENKNIKFFKF